MSDLEVAKGVSPFDDKSYIKNVFLSILSSRDKGNLSANACGDGVHQVYHRVAALSIDDYRSGCNVKYVEEVSYQSESAEADDAASRRPQATLAKNDRALADGKIFERENENRPASPKRKAKKQKKPVVVTCLKNSSVKFVRKTNRDVSKS